jgi:hypothetical protein
MYEFLNQNDHIFISCAYNAFPSLFCFSREIQAQTKYSYKTVTSHEPANGSLTTVFSKSVGSVPSSNILGKINVLYLLPIILHQYGNVNITGEGPILGA